MSNKIEQIESYISNLETIVARNSRNASEEEKKQLEVIASKTMAVLKETISRTQAVRSQITNDEEYDKFVDRVLEKATAVYRATLDKLNFINKRPVAPVKAEKKAEEKTEVKTEEKVEEKIEEKPEEKSEASFAAIQDNENIRPAARMAKNLKEFTESHPEEKLSSKVISIIDSGKTRDVINQLSLTALNVADKGLDMIISLLDKGNR